MRLRPIVAGALVLAAVTPARPQPDKCELAIGKATAKFDGKLLKGLQKCADFYRKALAKGTPLAIATFTLVCQ